MAALPARLEHIAHIGAPRGEPLFHTGLIAEHIARPLPDPPGSNAAYIARPFAGASVQYRAQCTEKRVPGAQVCGRVHCGGYCTAHYLRFPRPYIRAYIAGFFAARNVPGPGQNTRQCTRQCTVAARKTPSGAIQRKTSRREAGSRRKVSLDMFPRDGSGGTTRRN